LESSIDHATREEAVVEAASLAYSFCHVMICLVKTSIISLLLSSLNSADLSASFHHHASSAGCEVAFAAVYWLRPSRFCFLAVPFLCELPGAIGGAEPGGLGGCDAGKLGVPMGFGLLFVAGPRQLRFVLSYSTWGGWEILSPFVGA
ncbi:hypothetical protein KCU81_g438, partial [Aureobasidium melanogenum]